MDVVVVVPGEVHDGITTAPPTKSVVGRPNPFLRAIITSAAGSGHRPPTWGRGVHRPAARDVSR
eukprot:5806304-Pyramimonas_sp.AAC.1